MDRQPQPAQEIELSIEILLKYGFKIELDEAANGGYTYLSHPTLSLYFFIGCHYLVFEPKKLVAKLIFSDDKKTGWTPNHKGTMNYLSEVFTLMQMLTHQSLSVYGKNNS